MFAGTLRLFRRQMTVSTGKPIHTASSQITFTKAENILAIGTGILGLVMLGYEIMSVRDVTKSLDEFKVDMKAELNELKVDMKAELKELKVDMKAESKNNESRLYAQQERTDNLYKVLLEEQKQSSDRFYSLLQEIQKKG